ncbi:LD [Symbiodinium microadriaticum]|nr:LD [Symbiodinium microadriaticum]
MESGEVPAVPAPNLQDLAAQASLLQQEIKRQKILAPPDLIEQNSFLLRQEQRRWQDAVSSVEREPSQHEEKQAVLKEFQVCNRMHKVMTEVTNLIKQHAEGESRLIRAELAQLQSREADAPNQELQRQVQELQTAKQKLLESQPNAEISSANSKEPAGKGTGAKGGKGGKGGKGKGPPLPSSMPVPKPKAKCQVEKKKSNLVTLYWRPLPASVGKINASSSGLLKQCEEMLAAASGISEASYDEEQQLGAVYDKPEAPESDNLPESMIEVYFQRREAAVHLDSGKSDKISILDEKQRRMLGILMSKYRMKNKDSDREIVAIMKQAVLSCNYDVLREEGLCMLRKVIRDHAFTGNKIREFVQANGEAALKKLRDPWLHRLVYEVLKVPQIEERLECMLFQLAFEDGFAKCAQDMETLCQALQALSAKQVELRRFFTLAHRLGTALNSNCLAPQAPNGFSLSSLEKLIQTKSTASPKHNMLHFVLAMMTPSVAATLFTDTDIKLLAKAKAMKSFTVYQDCTELTQGFQAIRQICQTGRYQNTTTGEKVKMERRRMTKASRDEAEEMIDDNDTFHNAMQAFVDKYERQVAAVEQGCYCSFIMYKEQALFLGDLSVYPPPKEDQDGKADLVVIMHRLAVQVRRHAEEVEQDGLRESLAATCECGGA